MDTDGSVVVVSGRWCHCCGTFFSQPVSHYGALRKIPCSGMSWGGLER